MSDHNHKAITVLAVALLGFTTFQFTQILVDRDTIRKVQEQTKANIEQADKVLAENQKMLDQLNAIAIGTQRLADAGNTNAKEIVVQLGRLGIKINPNFKAGQEPSGSPGQPKPSPSVKAPAVPMDAKPSNP